MAKGKKPEPKKDKKKPMPFGKKGKDKCPDCGKAMTKGHKC